MTSEPTNVTPAEYAELAEHLRTKAKHENISMRMADICSRIGSVDSAVADGEKRIAKIREDEKAALADVEIAQAAFEKAKLDAGGVIADAKRERERIVANAKSEAEAQLAGIKKQIAEKQAELKTLSDRADRARTLLGSV